MNMDYGIYFSNLFKMAGISVVTYFICLWGYNLWDAHIEVSQITLIAKIVVITMFCAITYGSLAILIKIPYAQELIDRLKGKLLRK